MSCASLLGELFLLTLDLQWSLVKHGHCKCLLHCLIMEMMWKKEVARKPCFCLLCWMSSAGVFP